MDLFLIKLIKIKFSSIETIENKKVINLSNNFEHSLNGLEDRSIRGRSYSMATSFNDYLEKKKNINNSQKESKKNFQKNNSFVNLLDENDINLSKPITIDTLLNEKRKKSIYLFPK